MKIDRYQAARILVVHENTISNWVNSGRLPAGRAGFRRRVVIDLGELRSFARDNDMYFDEEIAREIESGEQ